MAPPDVALPDTCVVGEAYGFSSSYMRDCDRCTVFSQAFLHHFRAGSHDALRKAGRPAFVIHWNGSRKEVTSRLNSKVRRRLQWYDAFVRFDNRVLTTYK